MRNYIELELLGRGQKYKEQIELAKKLTKKYSYPQDYIKIALLQSLDHSKADAKYLKEYIEDIALVKDTDPISIALCVRAEKINIEDIDPSLSALLQARYANKLLAQNKLVEALQAYDNLALTKMLDIITITNWLKTSISIPQGSGSMLKRAEYSLSLIPDSLTVEGIIASYTLIHTYIKGNYKLAYDLVIEYGEFVKLPQKAFIVNAQIFFRYILNLCIHWQDNKDLYSHKPNTTPLEVFGESHSLSFSNINITLNNKNYKANTNFIIGIKMHHLKPNEDTFYSKALLLHFNQLEPNSDILFTIGEIDARPNEGIWQVHLKKEKPVEEIINNTVGVYIDFLNENLKDKQLSSITIQGIPAPNYELVGDKDPKDEVGFLNMIKQVNEKLKELTIDNGWNFLDVYNATVNQNGKSNGKWHIDGYHLKPSIYIQADKWLIKPEPKKQETKPNTIDFSQYSTVSLSKPN